MFGLSFGRTAKKTGSIDTAGAQRRIYPRRTADSCVAEIGDTTYPVLNWSESGILLGGDGRFIGDHTICPITIKFKMHDHIMNVRHQARVVRKAGDKTALQFLPLTPEVRRAFHQVVDDMVAAQMAG